MSTILSRAYPIAAVVFLACGVTSCQQSAAQQRPNILWISCEDISPNLGCYGDQDAKTPNIDVLAGRGVRYTHAFTTTGVCATNRSSIITGMYPTTIGTNYMRCRARLPKHIECFPALLRQAGYYCTNNSKTDYNLKPGVPDGVWDESSQSAHWKNRSPGQPFFHVKNFTNTHESRIWRRGAAHRKQTPRLTRHDRQDARAVHLPPYYPDTPEVRRDWANYLENITQLDYYVADLLKELDDAGVAEDTIVFFWSDHGAGLPRAKRWIYDSGTHVPLIVHIPEKFRVGEQSWPGTVSRQLISSMDLAPTVLNLAGVDIPEHMQGRAFLGDNLPPERDYVVSVRDRMDERPDMIRSVRNRRYRYIRNFMPWKPYAQHLQTAEKNQTMKALRQAHVQRNLPPAAELFMSPTKPEEELYDLTLDPYELVNLATSDKEDHQHVLKKMRDDLQQWTTRTRDLGYYPEAEILRLENELGNRMAILNRNEQPANYGLLRRVVGDPAAVVQLLVWMESDNPVVRYWAATRLGNRHQPARIHDEELIELLDDKSTIVRVAAARSLTRIGRNDIAIPVLADALSHQNPWLRLEAMIALDEAGEAARGAIPEIRVAMLDESPKYVARVARHLLGRLGFETVID